MMVMKKKALLIAFICLLAAATVWAGGESEQTDASTSAGNMTPRGTLPIVTEPVTLQILVAGDLATDFSKNYFFEWYQKVSNIDLDFVVTSTENWDEKMNLLFSSGDAPDVIGGWGNAQTNFEKSEILRLASQDLIIPLNDLITNWSENLIRLLNDEKNYPGLTESTSTPDGTIWGFPSFQNCTHCSMYQKMWVNQVWLENVGLDNPTTPEEFKEMLIAFRDQDANGNGDPNDEIPLVGATGTSFNQLDGFLMMPFQYTDANFERLALDSAGKVYPSYTQPGYREGLRYLADLFDEGLIYEESFVQDRNTMRALNAISTEGEPQKYGAVPGPHHGYTGVGGTAGEWRWRDWLPIKPLFGEDGNRYAANHLSRNWYRGPQIIITSDCDIPEIAFRWVDEMFDGIYDDNDGHPVAFIANFGIPEVQWLPADSGAIGLDGRPAPLKRAENPQLPEDHPYYGNSSYRAFSGPTNHSGWQVLPGKTWRDDYPGALEQFLYEVTVENYTPYAYPLELTLPSIFLSEDSALEIANIEVQLDGAVEAAVAKFVTGVWDIDDDGQWDRYLRELNSLGLQRYLDLYQIGLDGK